MPSIEDAGAGNGGQPIIGGYILLARKLLGSELMESKPAHFMKLWIWMLLKARWQDGDKLKRGQLLTTIAEMQEAGGHHVGYRQKKLTKDQVRSAYEHFSKTGMITTAKTTRGMVITIENYDAFQKSDSYVGHTEHYDGDTPNTTGTPHDRKEGFKKGSQEGKGKKSTPREGEKGPLPDWLPLEDWEDFLSMRKAKKKPVTEKASEIILKKLEHFKSEGYSVSEILQNSIINSWTGVFEPRQSHPQNESHGHRSTVFDGVVL